MTQELAPQIDRSVALVKQRIAEASAQELTAILGELEQLKAAAWARLVAPPGNGKAETAPSSEKDKLLTPEEAADLLSVKVTWLYRNW